MKKKIIALCLVICLAATAITGGTLAWLTDKTAEVKNTFNPTDIEVNLEETTDKFDMVPGWDIAKDPKAWVTEDSEDCYLFVKVEKSDNFDAFMTYEIAGGWTKLSDDDDDVYYMTFDSKDDTNTNVKGEKYSVLVGDKVTVSGEVDKEDMAAAEENKPTLTFTAYAHQLYKMDGEGNVVSFDVTEAWSNVNPTTP